MPTPTQTAEILLHDLSDTGPNTRHCNEPLAEESAMEEVEGQYFILRSRIRVFN